MWWAPRAIGWWIGILFLIGGAAFALGAYPAYSHAIGTHNSNVTFFIGSIFFTAAAFLQYLEMAAVIRTPDGAIPNLTRDHRWRLFSWEPTRIDWWVATSQLIGTLLFNFSTYNALRKGLGAVEAEQLVWVPDAYGSACFLIASGLAWLEVSHSWLSLRWRDISWWIAVLNLCGSVAFGISAIGAYTSLSGGQPLDPTAVNVGTLIGAVCFMGGAILLLPERVHLVDPALEAL